MQAIKVIYRKRSGFMVITSASLCVAITLLVPVHGAERDQPMHISARSVELNEKTGVATYRGDVALTRGETQIKADQLEVRSRNKRAEFVHAVGKPAKLRHRTTGGEEILISAREMEYHPVRQQIILRGQAQVQQGQNTIRGSVIQYDLNTKSFKAQAGPDADERVTAVIYPDSSGTKEQSAP